MTNAIVTTTAQNAIIPTQADSDDHLIKLWLHDKSGHSQASYSRHAKNLRDWTKQPLSQITLAMLQEWADGQTGYDNTRKQRIAAVKSLFTFGQKLGYLQFNVAAMLKTPKPKNTLAERILTESEVLTMIALTEKPRDKTLLRLLYASAGRVSEICGLTWADVQPSGQTGQVTLYGKGGETRAVKLSAETWKALQDLRPAIVPAHVAVFTSQKTAGPLDPSAVWRVVRSAAQRAGIKGAVSPHWFRHSHASHALDRGASVVLVRDTLGHSSLAVTSRYTHAKPDQSSAQYLAV